MLSTVRKVEIIHYSQLHSGNLVDWLQNSENQNRKWRLSNVSQKVPHLKYDLSAVRKGSLGKNDKIVERRIGWKNTKQQNSHSINELTRSKEVSNVYPAETLSHYLWVKCGVIGKWMNQCINWGEKAKSPQTCYSLTRLYNLFFRIDFDQTVTVNRTNRSSNVRYLVHFDFYSLKYARR